MKRRLVRVLSEIYCVECYMGWILLLLYAKSPGWSGATVEVEGDLFSILRKGEEADFFGESCLLLGLYGIKSRNLHYCVCML